MAERTAEHVETWNDGSLTFRPSLSLRPKNDVEATVRRR
jgi:hypothetical protein